MSPEDVVRRSNPGVGPGDDVAWTIKFPGTYKAEDPEALLGRLKLAFPSGRS